MCGFNIYLISILLSPVLLDSPDLKGKQTGIRFRPDIHVYLDCSGSISERNYQDAIKSLIKLAYT